MNREIILSALFDQLTSGDVFNTTGRRLPESWSKITEVPALFLVRRDEKYTDGPATRRRLVQIEAVVWLYTKVGPDEVPETALNAMLDAVEAAIAPPDPFRSPQTLGVPGVAYCRIQGDVITEIGHISGVALARVPITIEVAELSASA